jgi:signal peptide peptidase SppA
MLSLIEVVAGRPWAIRADLAAHVHALIQREGLAGLRHLAALKIEGHALAAGMAGRRSERGPGATVGVVPVIGILTQRGDVINSTETRSTSAVADEVQALAADPKVDAVVMEIDSPGGEVYGVPEAWQAIRDAAKIKPVVASANSFMASAALYLGSAATEVFVTPSGEAGSVGVYALHIDESKALEAEGVAVEFIVADESPFKVEGNPFEPLSDDARVDMKKMVNRYMGLFVRDLAKGRGVSVSHVLRNFGKGRMLGPEEAVAAKMADHVGTLDQAIRRAAQLGREMRERREAGVTPRVEDARSTADGPAWRCARHPDPCTDPKACVEREQAAARAASLDRLRHAL